MYKNKQELYANGKSANIPTLSSKQDGKHHETLSTRILELKQKAKNNIEISIKNHVLVAVLSISVLHAGIHITSVECTLMCTVVPKLRKS